MKPFTCFKSFLEKGSLKKHLRTFQPPMTTNSNGKATTYQGYHEHSTEKPFTCKKCSKSFSENGSLKRHLRTHSSEKPFTCKECSKSFSETISLKTHLRTC